MKKTIILMLTLLLSASAVYILLNANKHVNANKHDAPLCEANVEARTDCEIKDGKGTVVFLCKGENTCSEKKFGHILTCDGTKVE